MKVKPSARPDAAALQLQVDQQERHVVNVPTRVLSVRRIGAIARRMRMPVISMVGS